MIPLRDNIPPRTFPIVNYLTIALCAVAFFAQLADQKDGSDPLVERLGMIPARVLHPDRPIVQQEKKIVPVGYLFEERTVERELAAPSFNPWFTLLTCIFLHGGWLHFLGNMWFLHIFGDNVEDRFGHVGYLVFYLASGIVASATHLASAPASTVPTIGASGAIAGVMGAYFLLYPHAKVVSLLPIFAFIQIVVIPAPIFLGIWFLLQFLQGASSFGGDQTTGVAWWAHIGGFAAGFGAAWLLRQTDYLRPPVETRLPYTDRTQLYRYRRS